MYKDAYIFAGFMRCHKDNNTFITRWFPYHNIHGYHVI